MALAEREDGRMCATGGLLVDSMISRGPDFAARAVSPYTRRRPLCDAHMLGVLPMILCRTPSAARGRIMGQPEILPLVDVAWGSRAVKRY
jgi:hypothetical protein